VKKIQALLIALISFSISCTPELGSGREQPSPMNPFDFILLTVFYLVSGLFIYYFLVTKPRVLQEDKHKMFISGLKKNDEVITSSGMYGRVVSVKSNVVTLEIAPNVRIRHKGDQVFPVEQEKGNQNEKK
jgi:preprotein translocase subunit YajC